MTSLIQSKWRKSSQIDLSVFNLSVFRVSVFPEYAVLSTALVSRVGCSIFSVHEVTVADGDSTSVPHTLNLFEVHYDLIMMSL